MLQVQLARQMFFRAAENYVDARASQQNKRMDCLTQPANEDNEAA